MAKKGIIAVMACAFALCLALVGCGGSGSGSSSAPTEEEMKAAFAGTWEISGMVEDGQEMSADDLGTMKALGLTVLVELNEDGTGAFVMFGESIEGTWKASSMTEATLTIEDQDIAMTLKDGVLSMDDDGTSMTFEKVDAAAAASAAADDAAAAADDAADAAADDAAADDEGSSASEE